MTYIYYFLLIILIGYVIYLIYNIFYFKRLENKKVPQAPFPLPFISIVIAVRNEEKNIQSCLQSVLNQDYPKDLYEVILVDDHSEDATLKIAKGFQKNSDKLKIIELKDNIVNSQKKKALTTGIYHSKGKWIAVTDADCVVPTTWLSTLVNYISNEVAFIAGPVKMQTNSESWLEKMQALESSGLVFIAASNIEAGTPMLCNGANVLYNKRLFNDVGGFENIDSVASGDDELLMHKFHNQCFKIKYCLKKEAIVETLSCPDLVSFWEQRIRWVSKSKAYKNWRISLAQILVYLANLAVFCGMIGWLFDKWNWFIPVAFCSLKMLIDFVLLYNATRFLGNQRLLKLFIPTFFLNIIYVIIIGIAGNFVKKYNWKGRHVN